jgi:hypothetical protein
MSEPELTPSDASVVEIVPAQEDEDAIVLARPYYSAPIAGHVLRGVRVAVRGEWLAEESWGCRSKRYFALQPFGWICANQTRATNDPPTTEPVLQVPEDKTLPFRYVMVAVPQGESIPMWRNRQALRAYEAPERQLERGDTVAVSPALMRFEGASYYVAVDEKVIPVKGTYTLNPLSDWQGVPIDAQTHLPFAWVTRRNAPVYDAPGGKAFDAIERRMRVDVLEDQSIGKLRWSRIGEGRWMRADHLNEVRPLPRPASTTRNPQWLDVDLGEQVVVAYLEDRPVYATLISSGRAPNRTPRGDYPIWGKVTAITMKSQQYDDVAYYVNKVPWVLFFQAHNALHAAYWHDLFGVVKSHGCANLAPRDARYLFDWLEPKLPPGWTSVRFWDLNHAPVAHVHNSGFRRDFLQERNVGPPDKDEEADRLLQALARRDAMEREEEAKRLTSGTSLAPDLAVDPAQTVAPQAPGTQPGAPPLPPAPNFAAPNLAPPTATAPNPAAPGLVAPSAPAQSAQNSQPLR